jgi:hypothetical protein
VAIGGDNNGTAVVNNGAIPRTLTPEQQAKITSQVGVAPENFTGVTCLMGDQEGCGLADQIRRSLDNAGWQIPGLNQALFTTHMEGLFLIIAPQDATNPPDGAMRLYAALRSAGVDVMGLKQEGAPQGKFGLLVAASPIPR